MNEIEPQQGLDCVRIKFQMRLYLEQELAVDQTPPPHQGTIQRGIPRWGDHDVFLHISCPMFCDNIQSSFLPFAEQLVSKNLIE